jgi:hypothetical protein
MTFQATIIPPNGIDVKVWEVQVPSPDPSNKFGSFETVSHFVTISLCNGYTGADPEIEDLGGTIRIRFEGGQNFRHLERVLEWLSNPRSYNY